MAPHLPHQGASGLEALNTEALFRLDIKGDRQNLAYDSLHSASLPKYHHRSNAIGLDRGFRILPSASSSTRRQAVASTLDAGFRNPQSLLHWSTESEAVDLIHVSGQHIPHDADIIRQQSDFVAVEDGDRRKRRRLSHDEDDDNSGINDTEPSSEPNQNGLDTSLRSTYQRQGELRTRIASHPNDAEAWHALIELQADIVRSGEDTHRPLTTSQQNTLTTLKISVYEDAFKIVTDSIVRANLASAYMDVGSKQWDSKRQQKEWDALLQKSPSFDLWLQYLTFILTHSSAYSYERCIEAFQQCLQSEKVKPPSEDRDRNCLHLLCRLTAFMRQSGYPERAVATWQAMVELNLCRPASIPAGEELDRLEDFWESEVLRFGEDGATGWDSGSSPAPETRADSSPRSIESHRMFSDWVGAELGHSIMPRRSSDTDKLDDPYRVVLFNDIRDFMVLLQNPDPAPLVDAILSFCGLAPLPGPRTRRPWRDDAFILRPCARFFMHEIDLPFHGVNDSDALFAMLDDPFGSVSWHCPGHRLWAASCTEQLAFRFLSQDEFGLYALALVTSDHARKLAKRLLRQRPDSLKFYNALALVDRKGGKNNSADEVWRAMFTMQETADAKMLVAYYQGFNIWSLGKFSQLSELLASLSHGSTASEQASQSLLHTEHWLQTELSKAISAEREESIIYATGLLALTRYSRNDRSLKPALETYKTTIDILSTAATELTTSIVETLHQRRAYLLYIHTEKLKSHYPPRECLELITDSIAHFPHNTIFLRLYDLYHQRYGLVDRLRSLAVDRELPDTFHAAIQGIRTELKRIRHSELRGNEHSIRAAFEKGLRHREGDCPELVQSYVEWEISLVDDLEIPYDDVQISDDDDEAWYERFLQLPERPVLPDHVKRLQARQVKRARDAVRSSLRRFPWIKGIYVAVFMSKAMVEGLGPARCKELYEKMQDWGIRIRVEIPNAAFRGEA
jgi:hypothetical protein